VYALLLSAAADVTGFEGEGKQASERASEHFAYGRQMNIKIFQLVAATFAEGACKGGKSRPYTA
jgi:hypothetical protein